MNLILYASEDVGSDGRIRLSGPRLRHVREVLKAHVGDELAVGMFGGKVGKGTVVCLGDEVLEMEVLLDGDPPAPLPVTVILALPRPKVLRRTLYSLAVLGVKRIVLVNAARVEKSYWQSPFLSPDNLRQQLVRGLEQAGDTVLPEVVLKTLFKPFVQDELPAMAKGTAALVAHPGEPSVLFPAARGPVTLVVGPEGGFIPFELDLLLSLGCTRISLGPRKLNVETAIGALVGRMLP